MRLDIRARDFTLTEAFRVHTERRLHFALARVEDHILRVGIRLSDINGPRGGADKRCHIHVVLELLPDVVIEDTQRDLYVALPNGGQVVMMAMAATGVIFLSLSGYALTTRKDFSFMGSFLMVGILVAFLAGFGAIFLRSPGCFLSKCTSQY